MAQFLDHSDYGAAVRALMRGGNPRCAVAFWGKGASVSLFGNAPDLAIPRVVCDISMGGTNPQELRNFGAPNSVDIRHIRGLHSKVFIADTGAIIGSGNASENGIGFTSVAGLTEAGVHLVPSSQAYQRACRWFDAMFTTAEQVDEKVLAEAEAAWKRRVRAGGRPKKAATNPMSLLDAVLANPERFRGVGFVLTTSSTPAAVRTNSANALIAQDEAQNAPTTDAEKAKLKGWPAGNTFSNWPWADFSGWPECFICAHQSRKDISYYFYEKRRSIFTADNNGIIFARLSRSLRKDLSLLINPKAMAEADRSVLANLFSADGVDGARLFVNGEEFARALEAFIG